ncbi:MAG: hypothetical protein NC310_03340 [Roseburia sp.]|nr:hypothetical protein [Anaeroplasma bactoclasticum]MCM1196094.1 hypothetical protein [Roseburia sp.]MCM1557334.1 hypothetical protein [Anaeroplasma bactoclasticum]
MKKFLKAISIMSILFVMVLAMTSCSGYSFYKDFHDAGAEIEKDNIFELITLEEAKAKKENGDTFVLLYGSSSNSNCVNIVSTLQAQAEYLGNTEATIYFLNSKDYTTTSKCREVKDAIRMHDPSKDGSPIIMTFKATAVDIDTSNKDKVKTKEFIKDNVVQYDSLASEIFKNILK